MSSENYPKDVKLVWIHGTDNVYTAGIVNIWKSAIILNSKKDEQKNKNLQTSMEILITYRPHIEIDGKRENEKRQRRNEWNKRRKKKKQPKSKL